MPKVEFLEELFDLHHSYDLINLFSELKEKNIGFDILNKNNSKTQLMDFVNLIKYNIDMKHLYNQHYNNK
tara:strand:- start:438 stop:647 length:210 start_codon:yes stop_codon:yes gene_type:complete